MAAHVRVRLSAAAGVLVGIVLILAGCGGREAKLSTHPQDLQSFASKLMSLNTYEKFGLRHLSSGSGARSVHLQVRKLADFEQPVAESEKKQIVEAIYREIGFRVPLELDLLTLGEQPSITGKLTAIDGKRVLIVSTDYWIGSEPRMPDAMWFGMAADGVVMKDGAPIGQQSLQIGNEVKAWSEGLALASYPGQTTGLKVEVTGAGTAAEGDLTGTIDEISFGHQNMEDNYVVVSGQKYGLYDSTLVLLGEARTPVALADVKAGETVRVWFAGYGETNGPMQQLVTQIAIEK